MYMRPFFATANGDIRLTTRAGGGPIRVRDADRGPAFFDRKPTARQDAACAPRRPPSDEFSNDRG